MNRNIGIKFCGGCNPQYDRRRAKEYLEERLSLYFAKSGDTVSIDYAKDSVCYDYLIIIGGCNNCCAAHDTYEAEKIIKLRNSDDVLEAAATIEEDANGLEKILRKEFDNC